MQRLAELEHRVVRGVDDRRHGPHAARRQPGLGPDGGRATAEPRDDARDVAGAPVDRIDTHRRRRPRGVVGLVELEHRLRERRARQHRDLAGHPQHAQQVGPVRLHLDVEHLVVETERGHDIVARGGRLAVEHEDALVQIGDGQLSRRAEHAVGDDASEVAGGERLGERGHA